MRWSEERQVEGKPIKEEWQREIEKGGTDWKKKNQSKKWCSDDTVSLLKGQSIWFLRLKEAITNLVLESGG